MGLRFHDKYDNLYIADAYMGLIRVGPRGGEATVLAMEPDGMSFRFTKWGWTSTRLLETYIFTGSLVVA